MEVGAAQGQSEMQAQQVQAHIGAKLLREAQKIEGSQALQLIQSSAVSASPPGVGGQIDIVA